MGEKPCNITDCFNVYALKSYKAINCSCLMSPAFVKCACQSCTCEAKGATLVVRNGQSFCSDACATGHPNNEQCHGSGSCGCDCAGWSAAVIDGNFSDLLVGLFGMLEILVDPNTDFAKGTTGVRSLQSIDIAVPHAESFAAMEAAIA